MTFGYISKDHTINSAKEINAQQTFLEKGKSVKPSKEPIFASYEKSQKAPEVKNDISENEKIAISYTKILLSNNTPEQKAAEIIDIYYSEDSEYKSLSEQDKEKFRNKKIKDLYKMINPNGKELGEHQKKVLSVDAVILLGISKIKGLSLNDLNKMSAEERKELISNAKRQQFEEIKKFIPDFDKMTSKEKLYSIADLFLTLSDDTYKTLSKEDKHSYIENEFTKIINNILGISCKDLNVFLDKSGVNIDEISDFVSFLIQREGDINLTEIDNPLKQTGLFLDYLKSKDNNGELTPKEKKQLDFLNARYSLTLSIQKENPTMHITEKDLYLELQKKQKSGKLSEAEEKMLDLYHKMEKSNLSLNQPADILKSNFMQMQILGIKNIDDFIELKLGDLKPTDPEYEKKLQEINYADENIDLTSNIDAIQKHMQKKGCTSKEITSILSNCGINQNKIMIRAGQDNDSETFSKAQAANMKYGSEEVKNQTSKTTQTVIKSSFDKLFVTDASISSVKNGLEADAAIGLNKNDKFNISDKSNLAFEIANSQKLPPSQQASYSKNIIRYASSEQQIAFVQRLSQSNNSSVIEGLAAGSQYVTDSRAKKAYDSYVTNAAKKFPPAEQKKIYTALQTGEISAQTLAQNIAVPPTEKTSAASSISQPILKEAARITSYTSGVKENDPAKAYLSYLKEVTSRLEQKRDLTADKIKETKEHIETSQKAEETKQREKLYHGISEEVIKKLIDAYKYNGGASGLYAKLGELNLKDAQASFLVYFVKNANVSALRDFAAKYSNDGEVMHAICTFGDLSALSADLLVKCVEKGWINVTNIANLSSILNEQKSNLTFLRRIYDSTKNIQVFYYNFDLLTEYIALGKVNPAVLPPSLYQRYKLSLSPYEQQRLEGIYNSEKLALENTEIPDMGMPSELEDIAQTPVPGSARYNELNQQSSKYNPEDYFPKTAYNSQRLKKLNFKS